DSRSGAASLGGREPSEWGVRVRRKRVHNASLGGLGGVCWCCFERRCDRPGGEEADGTGDGYEGVVVMLQEPIPSLDATATAAAGAESTGSRGAFGNPPAGAGAAPALDPVSPSAGRSASSPVTGDGGGTLDPVAVFVAQVPGRIRRGIVREHAAYTRESLPGK